MTSVAGNSRLDSMFDSSGNYLAVRRRLTILKSDHRKLQKIFSWPGATFLMDMYTGVQGELHADQVI